MKNIIAVVLFLAALSVVAMAQAPTSGKIAGKGPGKHFPVRLAQPHACTFAKGHPCVYYGGDINCDDPNGNGYTNENSLFIPNSLTYTQVNSPVSFTIHGSFSNNFQSYTNDPATCTWAYRSGVSEGNGGTLIGSGDSKC